MGNVIKTTGVKIDASCIRSATTNKDFNELFIMSRYIGSSSDTWQSIANDVYNEDSTSYPTYFLDHELPTILATMQDREIKDGTYVNSSVWEYHVFKYNSTQYCGFVSGTVFDSRAGAFPIKFGERNSQRMITICLQA